MKKKLKAEACDDYAFKKCVKIMKIFLFITILSIGQLLAIESYSQRATISLDFHQSRLVQVLDEIENQSDYYFLFNEKLIDVNRKVDIQVKEQGIHEILTSLFAGTNVEFQIIDRKIVLSPGNENLLQKPKSVLVKGNVKDSNGNPLPGVTVVIKGTTQGAVADVDGSYSLSNIPSDATLVFSFVGMKTQELSVSGKTTIDVVMEDETVGLEEVVAIGYGTVARKDLTGSVTTVSAEDFDKIPASTPLQALQGRAAGVQIITSSGMPGAGASVQIRGVGSINGTNSPIYVVDGVIRTDINSLNPNSIESMTILKDASASAIYGARAANGVILVNTKRGEGKKDVEISLNAYTGLQTESNLKLKLLNASQWVDLYAEAYENAGEDVPWNSESLASYQGIDTNWKDLVTQTGIIQNYDLSVQGGSEKSNYYISGSFQDNKGMIIETNFKRYTLTLNTDHKINDWIKFGNSLNIFSEKREGTVKKGGTTSEVYELALRKIPLTRAYEDNGDYGIIRDPKLEHNHANPIWRAKETLNEIYNKGLQGNLYLDLSFMKNLIFTARGSMDYSTSYSTYFSPDVPAYYGWEGSGTNSVEKGYGETVHWITDFLLNYNTKILNDHKIKILLGYSLEESKDESLSGTRTGTPNNQIRYLSAGNPSSQINSNGFSDWAFISMFGRLNYNFKDKYLLTATIRRDGTSRLSEGFRFGVFPSVSIAYRVSEEGFLKSIDFIDDLKIRASYGTLGNVLSVGTYGTVAALSSQAEVLDNAPALGYTLISAINKEVKWESANKKNLGVDVTLLANKLYGTTDFFIEDTYDLLFSNPIPLSTGLSGQPLINAGKVRNTGYELQIGYRGRKSDWSYDISFNLSHVHNEVVDLGGRNLRTSGLIEDYPVNSSFGYKSNGLIRNENQLNIYQAGSFTQKQVGDVYLHDIDGYDAEGNLAGEPDGKVDAADRTIIGKKYPDFIYGALGTVSYKNWSLQIQLQGVQGIDKFNGPSGIGGLYLMANGIPENEETRILDRYHPTKNPKGKMPRLDIKDPGLNRATLSEFWLEDASYLRVKNVNMNYNLSKKYCSMLGMKAFGFYISIQNAWTFTKYSGPEVDTTSDALTGIPQPRTWTLGLKAIF